MELVTVTTSDFVRLHGAYSAASAPLRSSVTQGGADAAVLVHGIGGNFYSSRLLNHFGSTLRQLGISTVTVNTRGHDMVNLLSCGGKSRSCGAAFENVDECRFDLAAWHDFLVARGHDNILFLGHSLGAIKSLYSAAHSSPAPSETKMPSDQDRKPSAACGRLRAVIGLSPSRLSYRRMLETSSDGLFAETFAQCQQLIAMGRGAEPIQVRFPVATWMTPDCYVDKYGPDEKYNWLNFIDRIELPTLLVFGEAELKSHPAFIGLKEDFQPLRSGSSSTQIATIADADHFYSSKFDLVDDCITRWLIS